MIYLCSTAATSYEVTKAKSSILFQNKTKNLLYLMCDALDGFYFENTVWGFYRWGPLTGFYFVLFHSHTDTAL